MKNINSANLKRDFKIWFLLPILSVGTSLGVYLWSSSHSKSLKGLQLQRKQSIINNYNSQLIPLYQDKGKVIAQWLEKEKVKKACPSLVQDQVHAILQRLPQWQARSLADVGQMEEISSYLDMHWSQCLQNQDRVVSQSLEPLEREIRSKQGQLLASQSHLRSR